jgi:hypothetical protein
VSATGVTLASALVTWRRNDALARLRPVAVIASVEGSSLKFDEPVELEADEVAYVLAGDEGAGAAIRILGVLPGRQSVTIAEGGPAVVPGSRLCLAEGRFKIRRVSPASVGLVVDDASPFAPGDVVGTAEGAWAVVSSIQGNTLGLSGPLGGLRPGERVDRLAIVARTAVVEAGADGASMRLASILGISEGQVLVGARNGRAPKPIGTVRRIAGDRVTVDRPAEVTSGEVILALATPRRSRVKTISADGRSLTLDGPVPRLAALVGPDAGDRAELATVRSVDGQMVDLHTPFRSLRPGDVLAEMETIEAIEGRPTELELEIKLTSPGDVRSGDVIGLVNRWVSRTGGVGIAAVSGQRLTLETPIDALATGDVLGLADVTGDRAVLRVEEVGGLSAADPLLLGGTDARTGQAMLASAIIERVRPENRTITLRLGGLGDDVRLRPESLTLGFLFDARFADTFPAEARRNGLYVSWLGVMDERALAPPETDAAASSGGT